ncbi:hypothetical protein [Actinacidiphila acididurans]|uniref:Uncharacterized protein n=1 Tax=Actinacidiphila acididurans TaxID=2784346 RepID=A0ABS2TU00_9ACTN|nr:hypothetical protein [Actinacidiphila acididurans]MBM9506819.1 hypothetical protein [Actinacidiphila acididurans]
MSSDDGGKNAPLPRMSRQDAQTWAAHFTQSMARSAGVGIQEKSIDPQFHNCIGKHDEVVNDGRFDLTYRAEARLAPSLQGSAVARIRDDLKKRGYQITSFRDDNSVQPAVVLQAYSPDQHFSVDVSGYTSPDVLDFAVSTPCLIPPGAKQEKL